MGRLIAFGCSVTYGHGNTDCFTPPYGPGPAPSKIAWPALIANALNIDCINLADPGSSNKRIWYKIMNFEFEKDDVVFIMWSYPERTCLLDSNRHTDIGRWTEGSELYFDHFYTTFDSEMMSKLYVNHANLYLQNKKIATTNLVVEKKFSSIFTLSKEKTPHVKVYINDYRKKFNLGLDKKHPNDDCHREVARLIMNELHIEHNVPKQKKLTILQRWKNFRAKKNANRH